MNIHSVKITAEEIGDPWAAAEKARAFRKSCFSKPKRIEAAPAPAPAPAPVKVEKIYIVPIVGPCRPDDLFFKGYQVKEPEPENPPHPLVRDVIDVRSPHFLPSAKFEELAMRGLKVRDCIKFICKVESISFIDLISSRRTAPLVKPRQRACWLAKKFTIASFPQIGMVMGGRDHTTILFAIKRVNAQIDAGKWVPPTIEEVIHVLHGGASGESMEVCE